MQEAIAKHLMGLPSCPEALENANAFHGLRTSLHYAGALAGSGGRNELTILGGYLAPDPKGT